MLFLLVITGFIIAYISRIQRDKAIAAQAAAEKAAKAAQYSDSVSQAERRRAELNERLTREAKDTTAAAKAAQQRADSLATVAKENEISAKENEQLANTEREKAETEKRKAEILKEEAKDQTYKNVPSEYARLIREGPLNKKGILADTFQYKLPAYTEHLDRLGPLIEQTKDRDAVGKYKNLLNRLYYNNDLYEKIYACVENTMDAREKDKLFEVFPFKGKTNADLDRQGAAFQKINNEIRQSGKKILKYLEDQKDQLIIFATNDNWIHIYNSADNSAAGKIPMGGLVTALDYNPEKNIIYFGLQGGNIGYIKYGKDKKNQPVFENYLGTPVIAIQLFKTTINGKPGNFLLAAGRSSKVVVYELDENTLEPDKSLLGNILPEKKLGILTDARFDAALQRVVIWSKSANASLETTYKWNPFTAIALEDYKKVKNGSSYLDRTKFY